MRNLLLCVLCSMASIFVFSCTNEPFTISEEPKVSVWDGTTVDIEWYSEKANQFELTSASQFAGFAKLVNDGNSFEGKTVTLGVDIDLALKDWTPIGTGSRSGKGEAAGSKFFSGSFNGKNHAIKNLVINDDGSSKNCVGLFGIIKNGKVSNLVFKNAKVSASKSGVAGIAVGFAIDNSSVVGIKIDVNSSISASEAGGIVGRMTVSGSISNCENRASVSTVNGGAGGIVGKAYYSEENKAIVIKDCKNFGVISASNGGYVGGIAGLFAGEMTACSNDGKISGTNTSIGGIIGEMTSYGFVKNCTNTGDVLCNGLTDNIYGLGGIVGWVRYNSDSNDYSRTEIINISGNTNHASIVGEKNSGVGGVVGMLFNVANIENNTNNAASLDGFLFVSGIVGAHQINTGNNLHDDASVAKTTFKNNTSTTHNDAISGSLKSTIVYINESSKIPAENIVGNSPENKTF